MGIWQVIKMRTNPATRNGDVSAAVEKPSKVGLDPVGVL